MNTQPRERVLTGSPQAYSFLEVHRPSLRCSLAIHSQQDLMFPSLPSSQRPGKAAVSHRLLRSQPLGQAFSR